MTQHTELIARLEPFVQGLGKAILRETADALTAQALEIERLTDLLSIVDGSVTQAAQRCIARVAKVCDERNSLRAELDAIRAQLAAAQGQDLIEVMCARIKAADDAMADCDYMLDSADCISVIRGTWKPPMLNDKPAAPIPQQPAEPAQGQSHIGMVRPWGIDWEQSYYDRKSYEGSAVAVRYVKLEG